MPAACRRDALAGGKASAGRVEVMEIRDQLLQYHRGSWGWYAVGMLRGGRYP